MSIRDQNSPIELQLQISPLSFRIVPRTSHFLNLGSSTEGEKSIDALVIGGRVKGGRTAEERRHVDDAEKLARTKEGRRLGFELASD